MKYTTFCLNGRIVSLGNGGDSERLFPVSSITSIEVDWEKNSGVISFQLNNRDWVMVTFIEEDAGQECADAISDLCKAWNG